MGSPGAAKGYPEAGNALKFDPVNEAIFLWKRYGIAFVDDHQAEPFGWRLEWSKSRKRPVLWLSPQLFFELEPKMKSWANASP